MSIKSFLTLSLWIFFFCMNLPHTVHAEEKRPLVDQVASSMRWRNLLYFAGDRSLVESPDFFFDKSTGPKNPVAELKANLQAFSEIRSAGPNHPQCLFPARYQFLKQSFTLAPAINCNQIQEWKNNYAPSGVFLAYAAQFISNPASVFGHAFVVVSSKTQGQGLWMTYNYSAHMPNDVSPFSYVVGGLSGWFQGDYSVMPFYHRMYEYGSVENRDLWLYKIKVSPVEMDFFLAHLWELVHTAKFSYYFLDENCAGILQRTFAATLPGFENQSNLPLTVHPLEVIKLLKTKQRIESVELIPSQEAILRSQLELLDRPQKMVFAKALSLKNLDPQKADLRVSEALVEYTSYMTKKNQGTLPVDFKNLERQSYVARSRYSDPPDSMAPEVVNFKDPQRSHGSQMLQVGGSVISGQTILDFGYRFAIHDLLDPEPGYLENSSVKVFDLTLSLSHSKLWIKKITLAHVESFPDMILLDPKFSWRVELGLRENLFTQTQDDAFGFFRFGGGAATKLNKILYYALLTGDVNSVQVAPASTFQLGPEVGLITNELNGFKGAFSASYKINPLDSPNQSLTTVAAGLRYSMKPNWSVVPQLEWSRLNSPGIEAATASLGFRRYF